MENTSIDRKKDELIKCALSITCPKEQFIIFFLSNLQNKFLFKISGLFLELKNVPILSMASDCNLNKKSQKMEKLCQLFRCHRRNISARCFAVFFGVSDLSLSSSEGTGTYLWWPSSDPGEKKSLGLGIKPVPCQNLQSHCNTDS